MSGALFDTLIDRLGYLRIGVMAPAPLDEAAGSFPNPQSGKRDDRRNFLSSLDGVSGPISSSGFYGSSYASFFVSQIDLSQAVPFVSLVI